MNKRLGLKTLIMAFAVVVAGVFLLTLTYYTSESYLALNGESNMTIGLNGLYDEPGATAVLHGQDADDEIVVSGEVDTETPGTYTVEYSVGNFVVQRNVTVLDKMSPVIVLKGDKEMNMKLGDKFTEPGYAASDENGNDLTADVVVTNNEITRAGKQEVQYTVTAADGKATRLTRIVNVEPNTEIKTSGLPICMYHYVYDESDVPATVNANYISTTDLEEELKWLTSQGYYYPTWKEVRDYIDGKLILPEKSVVLTFDDGSSTFYKNGLPLLEKYKVPATSFLITSRDGEKKIAKYQSQYLNFESHSDNMHRGGGKIGHGGIMTVIGHDEGLADLKKSIEVTGSSDAFAYPFGDVNDSAKALVEEAGFGCAVTTVQGRAKPGMDPYKLPRQRMSRGQSMDAFKAMVMPLL